MKWLTLIIGAIIIIGGGWLLLTPQNAGGPTAPAFDEQVGEGSTDEAGTQDGDEGAKMEDGAMMEEKSGHNSTRSNKTSGSTPEEEEGEPQGDPIFHALVEYNAEGFSPDLVTINKGETIRFVNQAENGMWVGGDQHPTHTQYPEKSEADCLGTSFDTCRALQAGEFWEFTFNHVGSWGYHNHVRARDGGTIVVQ